MLVLIVTSILACFTLSTIYHAAIAKSPAVAQMERGWVGMLPKQPMSMSSTTPYFNSMHQSFFQFQTSETYMDAFLSENLELFCTINPIFPDTASCTKFANISDCLYRDFTFTHSRPLGLFPTYRITELVHLSISPTLCIQQLWTSNTKSHSPLTTRSES